MPWSRMRPPGSLDAVRVLVVEDEPETVELVALFLRDAGAEVLAVGDGEDALEVVDGFAPDVVVSDLSLPRLTGWDMVTALRDRGHDVPAVALSANANLTDMARALRSGFDVHVAKPVGSEDLVAAVLGVIDLRTAAPPSARKRALRSRVPPASLPRVDRDSEPPLR